jgi:NAD(P)-dependent dehydrogenase (short-subunit alcohol dehydrogenase family)
MSHFDGRVAVVTGAARGLGRDYARYFAADGAHVVLADLTADTVTRVATELSTDGTHCIGAAVDVRDRASTNALADLVRTEFGRADYLVNNAGLWRQLAGGLLDIDEDLWQQAWGVNVSGTLNATRAFVPLMREQGFGRVVNVSSMASHSGGGAYAVTKMAVNSLTLALASEVGAFGITVNCIAPGISAFEAAKGTIDNADAVVAANIVKRLGTARELYAAIRYLCSDDAAWTTGQTLHVNGGAFAVF